LTVAAPAVDQDPVVVPGIARGPRETAQVLAGPCIPRGLSPAELRDQAVGLASVLRALALAPVLALALPVRVVPAQVV
jgi:hypothetical protein